jgi:hypothetical protein
MSKHSEAFVAFDTSKLRNAVAIADGGREGEVRFLGEIDSSMAAITQLVRKLEANYERITFCYEAGPTGYELQRHIKALGHECLVVAPSLIPKKPGDRVKTNRRDAVSLVKLLRAGELTAVWVPDRRHEAMRDLTRARETAVIDLAGKAPAGLGIPAAPGSLVSGGQEDLDEGAHGMAGAAKVRAAGAAHGIRRNDICNPPGARTCRAAGASYPCCSAGLVAGQDGHGFYGIARHRSGLGGGLVGGAG